MITHSRACDKPNDANKSNSPQDFLAYDFFTYQRVLNFIRCLEAHGFCMRTKQRFNNGRIIELSVKFFITCLLLVSCV